MRFLRHDNTFIDNISDVYAAADSDDGNGDDNTSSNFDSCAVRSSRGRRPRGADETGGTGFLACDHNGSLQVIGLLVVLMVAPLIG